MDFNLRPMSIPLSNGNWFEKNYLSVLVALIAIAVATRVALIMGAPRPFGYVWDLYHEGVVWTYVHGKLPLPSDCGECYHPPLLFACGVPLYAFGASVLKGGAAQGLRLLSLFSMICSGFVIYYCHQILRLLRQSGGWLLLGVAFALVFPCLFIGSYAAENDMLLTALMSAFFYELCRYHLHPASSGWRAPICMGLLAGLSSLTKYSGLLTLVVAVLVIGPRLCAGCRRRRTARDLLVVVSIAVAVCGWHYVRNFDLRKKVLLGPPWDADVFNIDMAKVVRNKNRYDFHSFKVKEVVDLYSSEKVGTLNDFAVYDGVFTTLNALAWTDMSFFSIPSRHGWKLPVHYAEDGPDIPMVATTPASAPRVPVYIPKNVSTRLVDLVLRLGVIPTLLAFAGLLATRLRRSLQPFGVYAAVSLGVYVWWFLAQPSWALKTKYILFLLPVYIAYAILGLRAAYRLDRRIGVAAIIFLIAALFANEAYLWMFALG
jgi:hypothetical protein